MWEHYTLDNKIFGCENASIDYYNSIIINNFP
jgi:hypothetical protein